MRRAIAIGMALALGACGKSAQPVVAAEGPPQVRIVQVGGVQRGAQISGVGTVALRRETSLGFTSAGRIARLTVNEGDVVRRGQLLAALDTTTVSADLARAGAERDRAMAEYRRSETLLKQGWVTAPRVESARAAMLAAQAQMRSAGFQDNNAVIIAPGSGTVLARLAEPGQVVPVGTPVLIIGEAASGYVLRVPMTDRDAARLTRGAPAQVELAALDNVPVTGQVIEIAGRADRATGTFAVEIGLPADPRLRSGQIGTVRIASTGAPSTELTVPAAAVFAPRGGEAFVYVVDRASRVAHLRKVSIAETSDSGIRVTGGLAPGDWLATSRIDRLVDGVKIDPIRAVR